LFRGAGDRRGQMADEPELAEGAEGEWVEYLQQQLSSLGFYQGQIDGQFGATTVEAVSAVQQQYFIDEVGIVGAATWQALTEAGAAGGQQDATWDQASDDQAAQGGDWAGQAESPAAGTDAGVDKSPRAERFLNEEIDDPDTEEAEAPELDGSEIEETESVENA
jgi:peptidoglycan hydrolase-like protein with peptidoglycan-binding domain